MKRRDFIKNSLAASLLASTALTFGNIENLFAENYSPNENFDLVAVKNGAPDLMFDKAIEQLGGMKKIVSSGQKVVVKPNIGWDRTPDYAANTHPDLVKRIVEHCIEAGASDVYVFDNTCDEWQRCYQNSGIEKAVKDAGGKLVPANSEEYYKEVEIPNGKVLKNAKVHKLILESDVFINVPVLKSHKSARLTIAMKNHMGIVWDRRWWHKNDLHQCIADFATWCKPTLNIVDAYNVMLQNGPRGVSQEDVSNQKVLIVSADQVAADAAAAKVFGIEPDEIPYIVTASEMNVGRKDLDKLNIKRIKID